MNTQEYLHAEMDDILFEHRNKAYGAYVLRKSYNKNLQKACFISGLFFLSLFSIPLLAGKNENKSDKLLGTAIMLDEFSKPDKIEKESPPPVKKMEKVKFKPKIAFVQNRIVDDPKAPDEVLPPTVDDLKGNDPGKVTEIGDPNGISDPGPSTSGTGNTIDNQIIEPAVPNETPPLFVDQMPQFPDGEAALFRFLKENLRYPALARENNIEGTVYLRFVIGKDGSIQKAVVVRGVEGGCTEEALRVIRLMPKWKPGKQNGRETSVLFTLPIKFVLN